MGFDEFYERVASARNPIILRMLSAGSLKTNLQLQKHGDDLDWPLVLHDDTLKPQDQYIERLHALTQEIADSQASMRAVERYLGRFPFLKEGVSASSYIRFHLESYFNEGYILSERMRLFAQRLRREFRKADNRPSNLDARIDYAISETVRLFTPLKNMRGAHVHRKRYDDPELRRLAMLEMLADARPDVFGKHVPPVRRRARENAQGFVKHTNDGLAKKLDRFFDYFDGLVFRKDGAVRVPSDLAGQ